MKTYILIHLKLPGFLSRKIESLDIYGTISANSPEEAADEFGFRITHSNGLTGLRTRYYLNAGTGKCNLWFLEEVTVINRSMVPFVEKHLKGD